MVAISLVAVLGAAALALDGGTLLAERRRAHAVADAAALAGATVLFTNYPTNSGVDTGGTARSAALASASNNGYANDGTNSVVTVNIPPASGPFAGQASYIEVITQYNHPRGFSAIWDSSRMAVSARAVARGAWVPPDYGIITLDPTGNPTLNATGNGTVTVTGGGAVMVNSDASGALRTTGGGSMVASEFDVAGPGYTGTGFSTTPQVNQPPRQDPLRYLPEPSQPANGTISSVSNKGSGKTYTVTPGTFLASGSPKLPNFGNGDVVTFQSGVYYLLGGLTATGARVTATNVLFFNAGTGSSSAINISGGVVNITPMTSGLYKNIAFFQSRTSTQDMQVTGGGTTNIAGTFYLPAAELKITGSSGTANIGSQYISKSLTLGGNGNINVDYASGTLANQRLILLVE
jgi:hypothetical protein